MDMNIIFSFIALSMPLIFALYLIYTRTTLTPINKTILTNGLIISNLISLILLLIICFFCIQNSQIIWNICDLEHNELSYKISFSINSSNINYLIYTNSIFLLISLFSKKYFKKKKQFLFTKQRFYIYLSLLLFNTNIYLTSPNLIQCLFFWILQGVTIHIFSYFDVFKTPTNHNTARFNRISLIGDFSFILSCLILFRQAILSDNYIEYKTLSFEELNTLIGYSYGAMESFEFYTCFICFLIAIITKLAIFPMNCYYSFLANSSNIFYLTCANCANLILGVFLLDKISEFFNLLEINQELKIYFIIATLIALLGILFEKNIKIIFGYIFAFLNGIFIILFTQFQTKAIINLYLCINIVIIYLLTKLLYKDKINLKKRIINTKGFYLEKTHIYIFENLPNKIATIINFIDEKIVQKTPLIYEYIINLITKKILIENYKTNNFKIITNVLTIFTIFTLFAIYIALFRS